MEEDVEEVTEDEVDESEDDVQEAAPQETVNVFEETKSVAEVAKEVLAGDWGEGQNRRNALVAAGFDPNQVRQEAIRILNQGS
jgi:hypothetical protein